MARCRRKDYHFAEGAPEQHLLHRVHRQEVPLERERPIRHLREAALRLVAVGVKAVAQRELEIVAQVAQGRIGLIASGQHRRKPREGVPGPLIGATRTDFAKRRSHRK